MNQWSGPLDSHALTCKRWLVSFWAHILLFLPRTLMASSSRPATTLRRWKGVAHHGAHSCDRCDKKYKRVASRWLGPWEKEKASLWKNKRSLLVSKGGMFQCKGQLIWRPWEGAWPVREWMNGGGRKWARVRVLGVKTEGCAGSRKQSPKVLLFLEVLQTGNCFFLITS